MAQNLKQVSSDLQKIQQEAIKAADNVARLKQELAQVILQQTKATQSGAYNIPYARGRAVGEQVLERGTGGRYRLETFGRATIQSSAEMSRVISEITHQERVFASSVLQLNTSLGTLVQTIHGFARMAFPMLPAGAGANRSLLGPGGNFGVPIGRPYGQPYGGGGPINLGPAGLLGPGNQPYGLLGPGPLTTAGPRGGTMQGGPYTPRATTVIIDAIARDLSDIEARAARLSDPSTLRTAAGRPVRPTRETAEQRRGRRNIEDEIRRAEELAQLQRATRTGLGPVGFGNVIAAAGQQGFTEADLKRVRDFSNGYKQVSFRVKEAEGYFRELNTVVDRHGNVVSNTQKTYRTFLDSIRRNISEMIKWSAATLVVWGAIRKLSELLQTAINIQSELANVAVSLGQSGEALNKVFFAAADAAKASGEAIEGVIKGYAQAYRSTGSIKDATERTRVSQVLLKDALILSRLSSLDQASAMDTLTGALRQAGEPLDKGVVLLDKWVAISRVAGVGLDTLAEGFAITGTAAEGAGLNYSELAATLATMSEITTLSATEAGNAVRAFITGFTTDTAVREFQSFGISIEDINGNTRNFLDILNQVADLFEQGIISKDQLNAIAIAWGGGVRRGAQVAALIQNRDRIKELAEVTAQEGEAQKALQIQLNTVQTSITRLGNAFQVLAKSMGTEGGVLSSATVLIDSFSKIVELVASLTRNLGTLTPVLAGLAALMLTTSKETRGGWLAQMTAGFAAPTSPLLTRGPLTRRMFGQQGLATRGAQWLQAGGAGTAVGVGITAFSALQNVKQKDWAGAIGSIAGGVLGAIAGGPFGAIIGTSIGEAFTSATFGYKPEFERFFADIFEGAQGGAEGQPTAQQQITEDVFRETSRFEATMMSAMLNASYGLGKFLNVGGMGGAPAAQITPEQYAFDLATEQTRQRAFTAKAGQTAQTGRGGGIVVQETAAIRQYGEFLDEVIKKEQERARVSGLAGEITDKQLRDTLSLLPKLPASIIQYERTFGSALRTLDSGLTDVKSTYIDFVQTVIALSPEQLSYFNAIATEIDRIAGLIDVARQAGGASIIFKPDDPTTLEKNEQEIWSIVKAEEERNRLAKELATSYITASKAIDLSRITLPSITDLDIREEDVASLLERATEIRSKEIGATFAAGLNQGLTEEDIAGTFEEFFIRIGQAGGLKLIEGLTQSQITQALQELVSEGVVQPMGNLGLRQFDMPSGQFPAVMARYQQLVQSVQGQLGAQGIEWKPDEETFAGLFTDFIAMPITADLTLLNIAMQELIDVNKKQLDGIYNLPTDASFYVPFQGYQLGFANRGGGGGAATAAVIPPIVTGREEEWPSEARFTKMFAPQLKPKEEKIPDWMKNQYTLPPTQNIPYTPAFPGAEAIATAIPKGKGVGVGGFRGVGSAGVDLSNLLGEAYNKISEALKNITTQLTIQSTTNVSLVVDGQVLANVIKPYLLNETIRYEGTGGSAVKRFVI